MAEQAVNPDRDAAGPAAALSPGVHSVHVFTSFEGLPERFTAFLRDAAEQNFFHGARWYRAVLQKSGPRADESRIFVTECRGTPSAMLVARDRKSAGKLKSHMLLGPSHGPYALAYAPHLHAEYGIDGLNAIAAEIARASPPYHVLRFDSLDSEAKEFAALTKAWRAAGMLVQRFHNYHYFFDSVQGLSSESYLARQPPSLQALLNRLQRRVAHSDRYRFELVAGGPELKATLIDYALVDLQSPQEAEPYPDCVPEVIVAAAEAGALRLGVCFVDEVPAAAQVWIVSSGRATLWRSRHVKRLTSSAANMALMLRMVQHILAVDRVREIDFGPDDGIYRHEWRVQSRERMGLLVFNPRTLKGLIAAGRHLGGHAAMSAARRLARVLRRLLGRRIR